LVLVKRGPFTAVASSPTQRSTTPERVIYAALSSRCSSWRRYPQVQPVSPRVPFNVQCGQTVGICRLSVRGAIPTSSTNLV